MAGLDINLSNIVLIITLILVITGIVFSIFWFFKRTENLSDEDRLNIERAKVAWIGATALGVLILVAAKKEKTMSVSVSTGRSATLL